MIKLANLVYCQIDLLSQHLIFVNVIPAKIFLNSWVIIQILGCCLRDLMQPYCDQWKFSVNHIQSPTMYYLLFLSSYETEDLGC